MAGHSCARGPGAALGGGQRSAAPARRRTARPRAPPACPPQDPRHDALRMALPYTLHPGAATLMMPPRTCRSHTSSMRDSSTATACRAKRALCHESRSAAEARSSRNTSRAWRAHAKLMRSRSREAALPQAGLRTRIGAPRLQPRQHARAHVHPARLRRHRGRRGRRRRLRRARRRRVRLAAGLGRRGPGRRRGCRQLARARALGPQRGAVGRLHVRQRAPGVHQQAPHLLLQGQAGGRQGRGRLAARPRAGPCAVERLGGGVCAGAARRGERRQGPAVGPGVVLLGGRVVRVARGQTRSAAQALPLLRGTAEQCAASPVGWPGDRVTVPRGSGTARGALS